VEVLETAMTLKHKPSYVVSKINVTYEAVWTLLKRILNFNQHVSNKSVAKQVLHVFCSQTGSEFISKKIQKIIQVPLACSLS
jgi:hypothetical protein